MEPRVDLHCRKPVFAEAHTSLNATVATQTTATARLRVNFGLLKCALLYVHLRASSIHPSEIVQRKYLILLENCSSQRHKPWVHRGIGSTNRSDKLSKQSLLLDKAEHKLCRNVCPRQASPSTTIPQVVNMLMQQQLAISRQWGTGTTISSQDASL